MKKTFLILGMLLMVLSPFWNCSKPTRNEWQTIVNGKAVEYNTTVPVTNANVKLFAGTRTQAEAVTDVNGAFHFDFIATPGVVYAVLVTPDTMNPKKKYFQTRIWNIAEGQMNTFNYPVTPYAYVKMHLKNANSFDENDRISISSPLLKGRAFGGKNVDTTFIDYTASSNENVAIIYWTYRNGIDTLTRSSKFLPAHDTTFIEILY
jgi:hypothetical protein